jgi:hypothetical protein
MTNKKMAGEGCHQDEDIKEINRGIYSYLTPIKKNVRTNGYIE